MYPPTSWGENALTPLRIVMWTWTGTQFLAPVALWLYVVESVSVSYYSSYTYPMYCSSTTPP